MLRVSPGEWQETSPTCPTHAFYHRHPFPNEWIKVRSSRMKYRIENAAENTFPINGCHSINNWIAMRSIVCDFANEVLLNMHLVCIDLFWHKQSAAFIRPTPHPPLRTKHAHRAVTAAFAAIRCSFANESMIVFYIPPHRGPIHGTHNATTPGAVNEFNIASNQQQQQQNIFYRCAWLFERLNDERPIRINK